jgi:hypothetical protein
MPTLTHPEPLAFTTIRTRGFGIFLREIPITLVAILFLILLSVQWSPALQSVAAPDKYPATPDYVPSSLGQIAGLAPLTVRSLQRNQSLSDRLIAMTRLEHMQSAAVPNLLAALNDPDPTVRVAAVQVLGWIKSREAARALLGATTDPVPDVREAAIRALGELDLLEALPRLQQLQVVQSNFYAQEAAYLAEQKLNSKVATDLGLGQSQVEALCVAPASGWAYAVTFRGLYANQDGDWRLVESLPGIPTDVIATDSQGELVYVGTPTGLFKSADGGKSWQHTLIQLPATSSFLPTALALDSSNSQRLFVALAATAPSSSVPTTSLGIYVSNDGGSTFSFLQDSPRGYITTRLVLDPSLPGYIFGVTGIGTWRYTLDGYFLPSKTDPVH